jgi:xanthine dehydrogenase YagS FAD-binding subunit
VLLQVCDGVVTAARVAAGGVATVPWRLREVEEALVGAPAGTGAFEAAARRATTGAHALAHNAYKIPLLERTVLRALEEAAR